MAANGNYRQLVTKNTPKRKIPFTALRKIFTWQWLYVFHIRAAQNIYTYVANHQTHSDKKYALSYVNIQRHVSVAFATINRMSYKNTNINCNSK